MALPPAAKQQLVDILNEIERRLAWPPQLKQIMIYLIPKPLPGGGDRPIGLLCMLHRLWELIRQPPVLKWVRDKAGPWDQAAAGPSALRCALLRAAGVEAAVAAGFETVTTLMDLEKFYDTIGHTGLFKIATEQGAPLRTL